ncbi:MAG: T9SS type A sorting domain-containing protein [Candidatus Kapabacteria bacterium]|nr:T9SS type A sorting domain-containing protein [Candidatus Kapabacteria bacterium]
MKKILVTLLFCLSVCTVFAQLLPPKQAYPLNVKQIHSGHSLTDPLFFPHWPGQFVNLMGVKLNTQGGSLFDTRIGKSTTPGSPLRFRWENKVGYGAPDARLDIANWELLCITERVPLNYQGGNSQQWYLDGIQEQKEFLSRFVNNAWTNGNNGNGAATLLWTTWTNLDNSNGPWREMLDIQGAEFERMQDYANANKPANAPHVYIIPGHKMMARLYDDIQLGIVPGITSINQFFGDNIHTNELGAYAIAMIHYACIFNESPEGLPNNLLPNVPPTVQIPSPELAAYLQKMIWEVVLSYNRTGVTAPTSTSNEATNLLTVSPNPATDMIHISTQNEIITITNNLGCIIYNGRDNKINIKDFPSGIYYITVGNLHTSFVKY